MIGLAATALETDNAAEAPRLAEAALAVSARQPEVVKATGLIDRACSRLDA